MVQLDSDLDLAVICKLAKLSAEQKRQHWQRSRDAIGLLGLVRRHLRSLAMTLDPQFPDEDWGFTAQQAVEKP